MSSIAGSSTFISHLSQRSVIPGDRLERDHLDPRTVGLGCLPGRRGLFDLTTDVESAEVEEVDSLVNEENDLLVRFWLAIGLLRDSYQVATLMPHQHNRLCLRPMVAGKAEAGARNPLKEIPRASGIDVPGDLLHECSFLVLLEGISNRSRRQALY